MSENQKEHKVGIGGNLLLTILAFIILTSPVSIPFTWYILGQIYYTPSYSLKTNWSIEIPDSLHQIYRFKHRGFHNDGINYSVFENNDTWDIIYYFSSQKNETLEMEVETILNASDVPIDKEPPFTEEYLWHYMQNSYNGNKLYIVFFPTSNNFFFLELFAGSDI